MAYGIDSPGAPPPDDHMLREWSKVRSNLHESGHRFNSRYAQRMYSGVKADPQEILKYFTTMYERTVRMAVRTVTDHESAIACCTELDSLLKEMLKVASKLFREVLPRESRETSKTLCAELRRRLLPRSEHWKAEAHKFARRMQRSGDSSLTKKRTVAGDAQAPAAGAATPQDTSVAVGIMHTAMQQHGLNPPKLTAKILEILRRKRQTKATVDRTTVYRIIKGKTTRPQPATRNALIDALQLKGEDAMIVQRGLGGRPPHSS